MSQWNEPTMLSAFSRSFDAAYTREKIGCVEFIDDERLCKRSNTHLAAPPPPIGFLPSSSSGALKLQPPKWFSLCPLFFLFFGMCSRRLDVKVHATRIFGSDEPWFASVCTFYRPMPNCETSLINSTRIVRKFLVHLKQAHKFKPLFNHASAKMRPHR